MEFMFALVIVLFAIAWFFPAFVAGNRNHPSSTAISILCGIAPFTAGITWVIALIWAYNGQKNLAHITFSAQPTGEPTIESRLTELDGMLTRGVITQDEYDRSRASVLGLV